MTKNETKVIDAVKKSHDGLTLNELIVETKLGIYECRDAATSLVKKGLAVVVRKKLMLVKK